MNTNQHTGTRIDEIGDGIYRINTPLEIPNGAFSFNQYLVVDDEPLLFHTGPRKLFPFVREAVSRVIEPEHLRWIASRTSRRTSADRSTVARDRSAAPAAHSAVAAMVSVNDVADRPARALADGDALPRPPHRAVVPTRRTYRTDGRPATSPKSHRARSSAATSSPNPAAATTLSSPPTSSGPARRSAARWTTTLTRKRAAALRQARLVRTRDAGVHARQRVARRRRGAPARSRGCVRDVSLVWSAEATPPLSYSRN
jgi:hypothetical protein